MADNTLSVLKPSVNNLTVRIFVRAAGLDFEEIDVWGKKGTPEFLAKNPADLTPMLEEEGLPARLAVGELRDHAVPLQQARPGSVLPDRSGQARDGRQRDVLPDRHALPARRARDVPGARLPAVPGRGRLLRRRRGGEGAGAARRGRGASRSRSRSTTRSSSTASRSSAATTRRSPTSAWRRRSSSCTRSTTPSRPGRPSTWQRWRRRSATPTPSRPPTCAASWLRSRRRRPRVDEAQVLGLGVRGRRARAPAEVPNRRTLSARASAATAIRVMPPPRIDEIALARARVAPPAALAALVSDDPYERAAHTYGKSFRDVVRALARDFDDRARRGRAATRRARRRSRARVVQRRARRGDPVRRRLERRRRRRGRRRRRLPRRGHASTCATSTGCSRSTRLARRADPGRDARAGARRSSCGRTASRCATSRSRSSSRRSAAGSRRAPAATSRRCYTHIDEFVESVRVVTPSGRARDAAAAGIGRRARRPSGCSSARRATLGVITEAWMRAAGAPAFRAGAVGLLRRLRRRGARRARRRAVGAVPEQLPPARPRRGAAARAAATARTRSSCSASSRPTTRSSRGSRARSRSAREPCAAQARGRRGRRRAPRVWRAAFLRGPAPARRARPARAHARDIRDRGHVGPLRGVPRSACSARPRGRGRRRSAARGAVSCRFAHVYPDGPAPYYTVFAPGAPGGARAVGRDQARRVRGDHRHGGHNHPPPRGRPRPPAVVPARAAGARSPARCAPPRPSSTRPGS